MSASAISFFLVIGIICLILLSIPATIIYFLYKWLVRKGCKLLGLAIIFSSLLFVSYTIYTAFYPADSFYADEFKQATFREIPNSGVIIKKASSYPDFHGDYCSAAAIKLSKVDYQQLLNAINDDRRLQKENVWRSEELDEVMKDLKYDQIKLSFIKKESNQSERHCFISFLNDGQTIVIAVCKT